MKKLILICLMSLLTSLNVMSQEWYFIYSDLDPQGQDPDRRESFVIIKDRGGKYWITRHADGIDGWGSGLGKLQTNLLKSKSWYINEFNNAKFEYENEGSNHLRSPHNVLFHSMPIIQKTEKCYVFKYSSTQRIAVSLDFKTLVAPLDSPNPRYYTSYSASDFIVRKSVDDLF